MTTTSPTPRRRSRSPRASTTPKTSRRRATTTSRLRGFGLALGANLGRPRDAIAEALARFAARFGPLEVAPLYRTEPVVSAPRLPPQPSFLNTVALGATAEPPEALLDFALALEAALGRERSAPEAPRTIDLDLLFVGDEVRAGPRLELPHPRLRTRRFVLAPLADLAPELPLPPDGATPRQLLASLPERPWVERLAGGSA